MKKNLTDWLNGLGVPDTEPDISFEFNGIKEEVKEEIKEDLKEIEVNEVNEKVEVIEEFEKIEDIEKSEDAGVSSGAADIPVSKIILPDDESNENDKNVEDVEDDKNKNDDDNKKEPEILETENLEFEDLEAEELKYEDLGNLEVEDLGLEEAAEAKAEESEPEDLELEKLKSDALNLENEPELEDLELENNKNKTRKFLTEQDELQNLADAMLLDEKKDDELQPELYSNYSLDDIQQLEDYVEQLENLLDEQEEVLREEIKNSNVNRAENDIKKIEKIEKIEDKKFDDKKDSKNLDDNENSENDENINTALNIGSNADIFQEIVVRERDTEFTQQLHGALHNRKVLAIEKNNNLADTMAKKPKRRLKIAVICAVILVLALAASFGTLLYIRDKNNKNGKDINLNSEILRNENNESNEKVEIKEVKNDKNLENGNLRNENLNENLNVNLSLDLEKNSDDLVKEDLEIHENEKSSDVFTDNNNIKPAKPVTYKEYIEAGSAALNKKNWDEAILNFHKALNLNKLNIKSPDITPMIGLAGAYYEKGMFFDSLKIINEARAKFPKNSTIEFMRRLVRRAR